MRPDAMIFVFWMLNFKPAFSLSSFTFIRRLFSSSSVSAIRVVSYACLRLWYFSQQLIPACVSFRPAFYMVYSAFKLNKQGDNIQPCHTPFPLKAKQNLKNLMLPESQMKVTLSQNEFSLTFTKHLLWWHCRGCNLIKTASLPFEGILYSQPTNQ